jgi:ppGpp synthetase/RelA/SpoT-type nucleotidyltranferase
LIWSKVQREKLYWERGARRWGYALLMLSNTRLDKLGNKLKKGVELSKDELCDLLEWRNSFSPLLDYYQKKLKKKVASGDIVSIAKRLKRIESIRIKLKRFKTMRLSTLQDIAGIRVGQVSMHYLNLTLKVV